MTTAWDICGDAGLNPRGFTVGRSKVVWDDAQPTRDYLRVRIARLVPQADGLIRQMNRYIDANTEVHPLPEA